MKLIISFILGLIISFLVFHKSHPVQPDYESEHLKEELSSCQNSVKLANEAQILMQNRLSQCSTEHTKETASAPIENHPIESSQEDSTEHEEESVVKHEHEKNELVKNFKWIDQEKHIEEVTRGDSTSRTHFLNEVEIKNLDQVMKLTERTGTDTQSFQALQGNFHGTVKDTEVKGRDYQLELDVNFPPQGEGFYTLRMEGEGMHSATQGRGKPKSFRVLKGLTSKVIFIKMDSIVLQLYPKSSFFIGNAYKKTDKGFIKFGEFELTKD